MKNSTRYLNYIVIAAIFIIGTLYFMSSSSNSVSFGFNDENTVMTLSGIDDYSCDIVLAEIESVTFGEDMDYGTAVDGAENRSYCSGLWHNDTLGDYYLYVYTSFDEYILISTRTDTYVINLDNADATESFYESFLVFLEDNGVILK